MLGTPRSPILRSCRRECNVLSGGNLSLRVAKVSGLIQNGHEFPRHDWKTPTALENEDDIRCTVPTSGTSADGCRRSSGASDSDMRNHVSGR